MNDQQPGKAALPLTAEEIERMQELLQTQRDQISARNEILLTLRKCCAKLEELVAAQDAMLIAYRIGDHRKGAAASDRIGKAKQALEKVMQLKQRENNTQ